MHNCVCLAHRHFFFFRPRVVSGTLGSGARREHTRTPTSHVWALAEVLGTCAGGSMSREWASSHGEAFRVRGDIQAHSNLITG